MSISSVGGWSGQGYGHHIYASARNQLSQIFRSVNSSGADGISKSQFSQAFDTMDLPDAVKSQGSDAVFSKLDANGSGVVTRDEFVNGMMSLAGAKAPQRHWYDGIGNNPVSSDTSNTASAPSLAEAIQQALQQQNSQSASGSTSESGTSGGAPSLLDAIAAATGTTVGNIINTSS